MLRTTVKSLLSRKLRLMLSGLAVVLGVMAVSGAFVLTDTLGRSFDGLVANAYADTDVVVQPKAEIDAGVAGSDWLPGGLPDELVTKIRTVPGAASATGLVAVDGARVIGSNGKVVSTFGPRLGVNWAGESDLVKLREGRGPLADDEIVVNAGLATAAGIKVGDRVGVLTLQPKKTFTLVGIFGYRGGRDSLDGAQEVAFTEPVAQDLMLGRTGMYSTIDVKAAPGVNPVTLRDDLRVALGSGVEVKTGADLQQAESQQLKEGLTVVNKILLGFAGVALFVGIFLILNTFSIIVAQRTRELALMRALGGSRRQMVGAVLVEAVVIGLLASVVGLAAGIGVGGLLAWAVGKFAGELALAGLGVPAAAVISAFAVGVLVTVVAAIVPALRAARIPPVAALREAEIPDRSLTKITICGASVGAIGATLFTLGLAGKAGSNTLWVILGGVLVSFVGVALLTPVIARPVVSVLGRLFSWSVPGKLGRLNSGRNPRRTATTAGALMVGLALIVGVNTVLTSITESLHKDADTLFPADLVIQGDYFGGLPPTFDPAVLERARQIPGVEQVAGVYFDVALVNGEESVVSVITDVPAYASMFSMKTAEGSIGALGPDRVLIDAPRAKELGVHAGSPVTMQLPLGQERTMTVAGVYAENDDVSGWLLPTSVVPELLTPQPSVGYLDVRNGADLAAVRQRVEALLVDNPEIVVADRAALIAEVTVAFDFVQAMVEMLLALAIIIAVLGVINTLALSVLERTRELGLLRAIGLSRAQTRRMVTVEAVVISVFGALLGVAVGGGLGAVVVGAASDDGFASLALPWPSMALYCVLAAVIGVLAAIVPASRAARVNVLRAIAFE